MNNTTTTISTFHGDNSDITHIKAQYCQIMTMITKGILKFEPVIKIPIVANYAFFTVITFSNINSFT